MKIRTIAGAVIATAAAAALTIGAAAESYNAYIGFQTTPYSFRNKPTEPTYGVATDYFNSVIVWGGNDPETFPEYEDNFDYDISGYVLPATFTDAVIDKDGTYTVSVDGFDWALDGASAFNLLFVATDIPSDAGVTITDASIIVDGEVAETVAEPMVDPDDEKAGTLGILFANIWNTELESYKGAYPTKSLAIQFTVSGLGAADAEAPVEEAPSADETPADTTVDEAPAAGDVAAATDSSKGSPDTGIESVAAIGGLAILAGAAIAFTRKRK